MKRTNYWIIADTHFGHNKLVNDGYRKEGFEIEIFKNCGNLIKDDDIFIHLGDVSFYNNKYWHDALLDLIYAKRKILVLGNHDRETLSWYYDRGWSFVCHSFDLAIYGFNFKFSHRPLDNFSDGTNSGVVDFNIHGHLHDGSYRKDETSEFHYLISIENNFSPVKLLTISEELKGV